VEPELVESEVEPVEPELVSVEPELVEPVFAPVVLPVEEDPGLVEDEEPVSLPVDEDPVDPELDCTGASVVSVLPSVVVSVLPSAVTVPS
jgi:hypothetical protein